MGISGLLPYLKDITKSVHLREYQGKRVAVDGYVWLHRGAYSCSRDLCLGEKTDKYVVYCVGWVKLLLAYGVIPVIIFDGDRLPQKAVTEEQRGRNQKYNLERAQFYLKNGNNAAAEDCFKKAVDITPTMAKNFIVELQKLQVEFIVAPYEADAQMAYLAINNSVYAVVTEDSDLLVYGCPRVMFKLDKDGNGKQICLGDLGKNKTPPFSMFTHQMFVEMCILSGCDFLNNIPGIGINKAHHHMRTARGFVKAVKQMKLRGISVPPDYLVGVQLAIWVFKHQRVYCPQKKQVVHLQQIPDRGLIDSDMHVMDALPKAGDGDTLDFLGPPVQQQLATQIAQGLVDPITKQAFKEEDLNQQNQEQQAIISGKFWRTSGLKKNNTSGKQRRSGVQDINGGAIFKYLSQKPFKVPGTLTNKDNKTIPAPVAPTLQHNCHQNQILRSPKTIVQQPPHPICEFDRKNSNNQQDIDDVEKQITRPCDDDDDDDKRNTQFNEYNSNDQQKIDDCEKQISRACDDDNDSDDESKKQCGVGVREEQRRSCAPLFQQMMKKLEGKKSSKSNFEFLKKQLVTNELKDDKENVVISGKADNLHQISGFKILNQQSSRFDDQKNQLDSFQSKGLKSFNEGIQNGSDFDVQKNQVVSFESQNLDEGKSCRQKKNCEGFQNQQDLHDNLEIDNFQNLNQKGQFSKLLLAQSQIENRQYIEDQESFFDPKQSKNPNQIKKQNQNSEFLQMDQDQVCTPQKQIRSTNMSQSDNEKNLSQDSPFEKWMQQSEIQNRTNSQFTIANKFINQNNKDNRILFDYNQNIKEKQENICLRQTFIQSQPETPKMKCVLEEVLGMKRKKIESVENLGGDVSVQSPPSKYQNKLQNMLNQQTINQNLSPFQNPDLNIQNNQSLQKNYGQLNEQQNQNNNKINNNEIDENINLDFLQCMDKQESVFDLNCNDKMLNNNDQGFSSQSFSLNLSCDLSLDSNINSQKQQQQILCNTININDNDSSDDINMFQAQLEFPSSQSQQNLDEIFDQKNLNNTFNIFRFKNQDQNQVQKKPSRLQQMLSDSSNQLNIVSSLDENSSQKGDKLSSLFLKKQKKVQQKNSLFYPHYQNDDQKRRKMNFQTNLETRKIQFAENDDNDDCNSDDVTGKKEHIRKENQCLRNPLKQKQQNRNTSNTNFFQQFSFQNNQNSNFEAQDEKTDIQTICSSRAFLHQDGKFENIRHVGKFSKIAAKVVKELQQKHFQMHNIPIPATTVGEHAQNVENVENGGSEIEEHAQNVENVENVGNQIENQLQNSNQPAKRCQFISDRRSAAWQQNQQTKKRGKTKKQIKR